jgi:hypothetical protein
VDNMDELDPENEMLEESHILIPLVQETIIFHERPMVVVRLPNGEAGVVLRWICEGLHLDAGAQVKRIKRTEAMAEDLVYARIETDGGPQVLATLILRGVPYWLATIDIRRMDKNDPRRQEILEYQQKAADALYTWAMSIKEETRSNLVSDQPMVKPTAPSDEASLDEWQEFHRQMVKWIDWKRDMQKWRGSVEGRLDKLEGVTRRIAQQIGPPRITTEQQNLVHYYVSQLVKVTNKSQQTIFAALKTRFRVPRYDEIPESEWLEVQAWFKRQFPDRTLPITQQTFDFTENENDTE